MGIRENALLQGSLPNTFAFYLLARNDLSFHLWSYSSFFSLIIYDICIQLIAFNMPCHCRGERGFIAPIWGKKSGLSLWWAHAWCACLEQCSYVLSQAMRVRLTATNGSTCSYVITDLNLLYYSFFCCFRLKCLLLSNWKKKKLMNRRCYIFIVSASVDWHRLWEGSGILVFTIWQEILAWKYTSWLKKLFV